jgi:hypothetical protein
MIRVVSAFANTAIVTADAGGTYTVVAGSPLTFQPGRTHPHASYDWDFGDGGKASGETVAHTYADDGFYVLKLAVTVNEPGGALTRDFARVHVLNSPPQVEPLGDFSVDEGTVLDVSGRFSDAQWVDTHTALWNWGDDQAPSDGIVSESHQPPLGRGTASSSHAWGDAGDYTLTLTVVDDDGAAGSASGHVTVRNVPPTVCPPPPLFAYPCSPVTLRAKFTDPGWLDRHTGQWLTGDGGPAQQAVIEERNTPPIGRGIASVTHVYAQCGRYCCLCTVTDDDGTSGQASSCVEVVDVVNRDFELGFRSLPPGLVANGWTPYAATVPRFGVPSRPLDSAPDSFAAEAFVVHGGRRAQRVRAALGTRAGVLQSIGANPHWEYEFSLRYWIDPASYGMVRLGFDPLGGNDPATKSVAWVPGRHAEDWSSVTLRGIAQAAQVTVFLEAFGREDPLDEDDEEPAPGRGRGLRGEAITAYFDRVRLVALQHLDPKDPNFDLEIRQPDPARPDPAQPHGGNHD